VDRTIDSDGAISTMNVTYNHLGLSPLICSSHLAFGLQSATTAITISFCLARLGYALEQQTLRMWERRLGICCYLWRYMFLACYAITTHCRSRRIYSIGETSDVARLKEQSFESTIFNTHQSIPDLTPWHSQSDGPHAVQ
jgi:hypothetical protein